MISLDAIFGLKRWKKAKGIDTTPRHGTRMFMNQESVDDYMKNYNNKANIKSALQVGVKSHASLN